MIFFFLENKNLWQNLPYFLMNLENNNNNKDHKRHLSVLIGK